MRRTRPTHTSWYRDWRDATEVIELMHGERILVYGRERFHDKLTGNHVTYCWRLAGKTGAKRTGAWLTDQDLEQTRMQARFCMQVPAREVPSA